MPLRDQEDAIYAFLMQAKSLSNFFSAVDKVQDIRTRTLPCRKAHTGSKRTYGTFTHFMHLGTIELFNQWLCCSIATSFFPLAMK